MDVARRAPVVLGKAVTAVTFAISRAPGFAKMSIAPQTERARATADQVLRLDPDPLPDDESRHSRSNRRDLAGQLVAILTPNPPRLTRLLPRRVAAVPVQVASANSRRPNAHQNVTRTRHGRRSLLDADVGSAVEQRGFHNVYSSSPRHEHRLHRRIDSGATVDAPAE